MEIENLSLEELVKLNSKIIKRIRELNKIRLCSDLQKFEVGDRVCFDGNGSIITGVVIRVNQKSLTIKTDQGMWYVAPKLVKKTSTFPTKQENNIFHSTGIEWLKN